MTPNSTPRQSWRRPSESSRFGRQFLAIAATGLSLSLILAGCSGSSVATTGGVGAQLKIGEQQGPNSLDPALADQNADFVIPAYEPLVHLNGDGSLSPALAKSWKMGDGNRSITLTIRSGVKFTDGSKVTADAVKASLEYSRGSHGVNSGILAGSTIASAGNSVTITLPQPDPVLAAQLSQWFSIGLIISPTGLANPKILSPSTTSQGAGPYIYDAKDSVEGDHYTYTANPTYYDPSRQHFKKIVMSIVNDTQTLVNAASTGQLDAFVGDFAIEAQAKSSGLQVVSGNSLYEGLFFFDKDGVLSKPLADVRVRQAINYAINRKTIATAVFGKSDVAAVQIFAPGTDGFSKDAESAYAYDPKKAKKLLADAGYPDGFSFDAITADFGGFATVAKAVAGQLAAVGITMKISSDSNGGTWVGHITSKAFPVGVQGNAAYPPYLACQDVLLPTASPVLNPFHSTSNELEALCAKIAAGTAGQQDALGQKLSKWVVDNAWIAPVVYSSLVYVASKKITGIELNPVNGFADPLGYRLAK